MDARSRIELERDEIVEQIDIFLYGQHDPELESLINRRQRQILVHSIIYYRYDENVISDHTWAVWATELVELQKKYPGLAAKQPYGETFKGFDGSTGYDLPLGDPKANAVAKRLMTMARERNVI